MFYGLTLDGLIQSYPCRPVELCVTFFYQIEIIKKPLLTV
jgi:hypothetical protein